MRQVIVGNFSLGAEYCQLVFREGCGGEFYFMPELGHVPRIKIGADCETWEKVLATLLHEAMELVLGRLRLRYIPQDDFGNDVHSYLLIVPHEKYSDACARVAKFLIEALPAAEKAWREWKRPGRPNSVRPAPFPEEQEKSSKTGVRTPQIAKDSYRHHPAGRGRE